MKIQGNQIRFIFNKYNTGRQINFELGNLFDSLEPKLISKNFKSNYVTFILKKKQPKKWPGLYENSKNKNFKNRYAQKPEEFETRKDYLKNLKKFNSIGKSKERNNRYMFADDENFDKYAVLVPEEDRIIEEGDEGSVGSNRIGSHRLLPSTKDISNKVDDILKGFDEFRYETKEEDSHGNTTKMTEGLNKTEIESFLKNENKVNGFYDKKKQNPKLYMKNGKKIEKNKRKYNTYDINQKQGESNNKSAKLYQNNRNQRLKSGVKSSYKNRYMQKSQDREDRRAKRKKQGKSANQKTSKGRSYIDKIKKGPVNLMQMGISDRYPSNQDPSIKKNYFNSWLNKTEDSDHNDNDVLDLEEINNRPENITKKGFKKTINNELMTIDEIIALEKKEAQQNSKLRRATENRNKKIKKAQNKSKSRTIIEKGINKNLKSNTRNKVQVKKNKFSRYKDIEIDSNKNGMYNEGSKSGTSMHKNKIPIGTFTTRKGEFNKIFDLHQNKEITSQQIPLNPTGHREKTNQELQELKMSRKSVKNIEVLSRALLDMDSQKDLNKESFVENFPSNVPSKGDNQVQFGSRLVSKNNSENEEIDMKSNLVSIKSEIPNPKNIFLENEKPQTKSNINLQGKEQNILERSKSRPIQKAKGFYEKKTKKKTIRSRSSIKPGYKSRLAKTERGLSQNLSNLAPQTVVSYDGPNVSIVSQKLREKRGEILDTFAQLNLDMAWVHRQCRYIDLHSTQGVLKFFELQNRLIVKLATKLRKEKNSRFKVEKQCEKMMDNFKKDLKKK